MTKKYISCKYTRSETVTEIADTVQLLNGVTVFQIYGNCPLYNNDGIKIGNLSFTCNVQNIKNNNNQNFSNVLETVTLFFDGIGNIVYNIPYILSGINNIYFACGSKIVTNVITCSGLWNLHKGFIAIDILNDNDTKVISIELEEIL